LRAGQLAEAERGACEALGRDPERGHAYNLIAIVRLVQHKLAAAKALVRAGIAVDPGCDCLQTNLVRMGRTGSGPLLLGDEVIEAYPYRVGAKLARGAGDR
jgi:hypothetical protein